MSYLGVFLTVIVVYFPIALIIVLSIYALFLSIKALKIYISKNN